MSNSSICLKVDHNATYVEGRLDSPIYQGLKKKLGYRPENAHWMIRKRPANKKWMKDWDGIVSNVCRSKKWCKCFLKKDGIHFSSGLLSQARDYFKEKDVKYTLIDIRDTNATEIDLEMSDEFEIRDYQVEVIKNAVKKQRGIIRAATGAGKTGMASGIIAEIGKVPFVFYVTSIDLLKQAKSELEKFLKYDGSALKVGSIGDGACDIQDINVMTVQTAIRALDAKYEKFDDEDTGQDNTELGNMKEDVKDLIMSAKGIVADETQHWAAKTCQVIADASVSAQYRYGMSATPWRDMGDDILIDACFGRLIADISASFLIERDWLIKPEIFFVPIKNMIGMPKYSYAEIYKQAIVENSLRNANIANIANTMRENGRIVLCLCKQIAHGEILSKLIPDSVFLHGTHSGKVRKEHLEKMRRRDASVTIATSIFDEGIDCKPLDTLILAGSGKSQTRALQRVGRVLRKHPGKKDAIVVDFEDHCKFLLGHSQKRRKIYETEPEFKIKYLT